MAIDPKSIRPRRLAGLRTASTKHLRPTAPKTDAPSTPAAPSRPSPARADAFESRRAPGLLQATQPPPSVEAASQALGVLHPGAQDRFRQLLSFDPTGPLAKAISAAISTGPLQSREAAEQAAFASVLGVLPEAGVRAVAALAVDSKSPLWLRDSRVGSVMEAANELLETPMRAWPRSAVSQSQLVCDVLTTLASVSGRRLSGLSAPAAVLLRLAPHRLLHLLSGMLAAPSKVPEGAGSRQFIDAAAQTISAGASTPGEALRRVYAYAAELAFTVREPTSPAAALSLLRDAPTQVGRPVIVDLEHGPARYAIEVERRQGDAVLFRDPRGALRSAALATLATLTSQVSFPRA